MNAIELLTTQHDDVDHQFAALEKATDGREKRALFTKLADQLVAHITIEEKLFYPVVMAKQIEDKLHEAVEEHLAAKRLIADLLALPAGDPQFDAKMSVLKEALDHHNHKEEEGELFPKVKKLVDAELLRALGGEMLSMFETLVAGSPHTLVASQLADAARLPAP